MAKKISPAQEKKIAEKMHILSQEGKYPHDQQLAIAMRYAGVPPLKKKKK